MNRVGFWPVIIILISNSLLALILMILAYFQENKKRNTMFLFSWFVFIVPLIGIVYILLGLLINRIMRKRNVDLSDVSFDREREKIILPPNQEVEMNFVPIHDAIAISDTASLRRLLLDTMLSNAKRKVSNVAVAVNSDDTEASHYAATMIMDLLSELRSAAQSMLESMQKRPEDVEMNLLTFDYIYEFLSLEIMSSVEKEAYVHTLDDVAENLFTHNLWYMTATHYLQITDMSISIKDYSMADKWCSRARKYRPNELDTYKARLHLYYEQHNYNAFFECLNDLKKTDIKIDKEIADLFDIYY